MGFFTDFVEQEMMKEVNGEKERVVKPIEKQAINAMKAIGVIPGMEIFTSNQDENRVQFDFDNDNKRLRGTFSAKDKKMSLRFDFPFSVRDMAIVPMAIAINDLNNKYLEDGTMVHFAMDSTSGYVYCLNMKMLDSDMPFDEVDLIDMILELQEVAYKHYAFLSAVAMGIFPEDAFSYFTEMIEKANDGLHEDSCQPEKFKYGCMEDKPDYFKENDAAEDDESEDEEDEKDEEDVDDLFSGLIHTMPIPDFARHRQAIHGLDDCDKESEQHSSNDSPFKVNSPMEDEVDYEFRKRMRERYETMKRRLYEDVGISESEQEEVEKSKEDLSNPEEKNSSEAKNEIRKSKFFDFSEEEYNEDDEEVF